ncbi:MAG: hypothetical protein P8X74_23475 [Reinekea sp.]
MISICFLKIAGALRRYGVTDSGSRIVIKTCQKSSPGRQPGATRLALNGRQCDWLEGGAQLPSPALTRAFQAVAWRGLCGTVQFYPRYVE